MSTNLSTVVMVALAMVSAARDAASAPLPQNLQRTSSAQHTAHIVVKSSLERSLSAVEPRWGKTLAAEIARLLRWRGDVRRRVRPGDTLALVWRMGEQRPGLVQLPEIVALRYLGSHLVLNAYHFVDVDGVARYFDADGVRVEPLMLHAPVPHYAQISEVVQHGRGLRRHRGDDLMAAEGAAVVLPFPGKVLRLNWSKKHNGRCVEVLLDAGYMAHFLHLKDVAHGLAVGQKLAAGTPLGTVGNTGHSQGPHLHYELLRQKNPVEPLRIHGRRQARLRSDQQDAFARMRLQLDAKMRSQA